MSGQNSVKKFLVFPVVLNLLLKACMNGVLTISGGNEFPLFTTLILKANHFFFSFYTGWYI